MRSLDATIGVSPTATLADLDVAGRSFEDWIVGTLEGQADREGPANVSGGVSDVPSPWLSLARRALTRLPVQAQDPDPDEPRSRKEKPQVGIQVTDIHGISVVKPKNYALLQDEEFDAIGVELDRLIAVGRVRIVLNLGEVHRVASRFLGVIVEAHRRCAAAGGMLKLCGLRPTVAEAIIVTGLRRRFVVAADETLALDGAWPLPPLRPLPVETLLDLLGRGETVPAEAGPTTENEAASPPVATELSVRLVVASGRSRGRAIPVVASRFVIGRDPRCHLRSDGAGVSRAHAIIERRDGRVFVRDLGSANGTILNGTILWREEAEIADGDRLRIGRLRLTVAIGDRIKADARGVEHVVAAWLRDEDGPTADPCAETMLNLSPFIEVESAPAPSTAPTAVQPVSLPEMATGFLDCQVIQGVLVIRLRACPNDDATIDPIRSALELLYERPLVPRRVVLDLGGMAALSGRFVGVLVAHALRLGRAGGGLRLCQPSARVLSVLESIGLPRVIATYLSVNEAILAA